MSEPKPAASLSPSLLARKGGAKPAMRPQLQPMSQFHEASAREMGDDLGWNDHGEDTPVAAGEVVSINGQMHDGDERPAVHEQQQSLEQHFERPQKPRRSAFETGRRAAFTLRIDAERHLRLRLASTITNRSAQQIVTEALDSLLESMPEVETLAARVRKSS